MPCHAALAASALSFLAIASAHIMLENPVPFGKATLNNSPLEGSGSDFPCKQRDGVYALTQWNEWRAGDVQRIRFAGSAVHGGGSCQFSLTTDLQPTKASQWKVIHSIVGGCPSNATGNLAGGGVDGGVDGGPATFDITLPEEIPDGQYTFAWTWFNRQGNREMYMNCAPITVSGGEGDGDFFQKLPDMFVANLPPTACATAENSDFAFPRPGDSVVTAQNAKIDTSLSGTGCASMTKMGAGAGQAGPPRPAAHDVSSIVFFDYHPSSFSTAITPSSANVGEEAIGPVQPTFSDSPHAPVTAAREATALQAAQSLTTTCLPCANHGGVLCIGTSQFGLCNHGCASPQPLAAGTTCSEGLIA
ncbi:hypothetical protein BS50DRAFT_580523 [Corynespora cassiicola Philippines]|uniref:Lytic polysaccharide monooxygenase n=1 Tax=Corynespora cassiicola Philippines TaxID=1448308 RepID=A0A2T2MZT5_CORCC|nr:hypothetical protein BS50DRAFT_580523 [Corynespora cassiicola Philippines]